MKNILLAIMLIALPAAAFSQNKALNKFYRHYKRESGVQNAKLPGWLVRFGGKIAKKKVESEEEKLAMNLLKNFGSVRFMYMEDGKAIPNNAIQKLRQNLLNEEFDDLIMVKSGEMNFQLMIQEEGEIIKNLFMLYNSHEDGEMVFISAKTNIRYDDLKELIKKAMEKETKEFFEEKQEEPIAEPVL